MLLLEGEQRSFWGNGGAMALSEVQLLSAGCEYHLDFFKFGEIVSGLDWRVTRLSS